MVYTKLGPFTNGSATPPINAALINGIETELYSASNIAWTTYTPNSTTSITSFGGTGTTVSFRWRYVGGLVHVQGVVTLGSGGGCSGNVFFNLPVNANVSNTVAPICSVILRQASSNTQVGGFIVVTPTAAQVLAAGVSGGYVAATILGPSIPFAWTTNDQLTVDLLYAPN